MSFSTENKNAENASPGRVLLVEDEILNREVLEAYLGNAGYEVVAANDGAEAWAMLSKDAGYDLILTDKRMPNMNGLDLAMHVRNDHRTRDIPVIMQTGAASQDDMLEGIRAGVYYYLFKPYEEAVLLGIVRSAVHARRQKASFDQRLVRQQSAFRTFVAGEFHVATPQDAENLALLLGSAYGHPWLAVSGLYELLLNAVEHGILGIGFEEKDRLLSAGKWQEEMERRLMLPAAAGRKAVVTFRQAAGQIEVIINDGGPGFDWRPFMEIEPARAMRGNGRGIAKAALVSFDKVEFIGNGSKVRILGK